MASPEDTADDPHGDRIPVLREELDVGRREAVTGTVRVHTTVHERVEHVRERTLHDDVVVDRVPVNRYVEARQPERRAGDVLVVPLHAEVVTVQRRLLVTEELRIRRRRREEPVEQDVVLREEQASVERRQGKAT